MSTNENKQEEKKLKKFRIFLITVISALIIGIGLAVVFLFIRTKDSKPSGVMKSDVSSEVSDKSDNDGKNDAAKAV